MSLSLVYESIVKPGKDINLLLRSRSILLLACLKTSVCCIDICVLETENMELPVGPVGAVSRPGQAQLEP